MLIFYPVTLLNSLISSNNFLVVSLGFSTYEIISSANKDNFTSTFFIWMPFISLCYLVPIAVTSSTVLTRSGESCHPSLVSDLILEEKFPTFQH